MAATMAPARRSRIAGVPADARRSRTPGTGLLNGRPYYRIGPCPRQPQAPLTGTGSTQAPKTLAISASRAAGEMGLDT